MEKIILVCDECATEKGQGNHWFFASQSATETPRLMLGPLASRGVGDVVHLCGIECALKYTGKFLNSTLK